MMWTRWNDCSARPLPESRARYLKSFLVPDEPGQQRPLLVKVGPRSASDSRKDMGFLLEPYTGEEMDGHPTTFQGARSPSGDDVQREALTLLTRSPLHKKGRVCTIRHITLTPVNGVGSVRES